MRIPAYLLFHFASFFDELFASVSEVFVRFQTFLNFWNLENELETDSKVNQQKKKLLLLFNYEK